MELKTLKKAAVIPFAEMSKLFAEFFNSKKSEGIILVICTAASLLLANFFIGEDYLRFWHQKIFNGLSGIGLGLSLEHWINDGFMAVFFLLVGLEIEREIYVGELKNIKDSLVPVIAALGGILAPAMIHIAINTGTYTVDGFGIPMATDIAFALGIMSLAGSRVPFALKIFLTALAIIDDLAAIIIIAIFYSKDINALYLAVAGGIFMLLFLLNRAKVNSLFWYIAGGVIMWYCFLQSGVHATIAGVLLAFVIPFRDGGERSPSYRLQHGLHKPVAFVIMPLFALANTGILIQEESGTMLISNNSLGIMLGLVLGKPLGILLFVFTAVKLEIISLPDGIHWRHLVATGFLAGIGFTMSIFIALLAFDDEMIINQSKLAVLISSFIAGLTGFILLKYAIRDKKAS